MNLKEQAEIIAAAIAGKDLILQKRSGVIGTRFSPGPDLRFNFQDYIHEVADMEIRILHQYIVRTPSGEYKLTTNFYPCTAAVKAGFSNHAILGPAAWTRIEVQA